MDWTKQSLGLVVKKLKISYRSTFRVVLMDLINSLQMGQWIKSKQGLLYWLSMGLANWFFSNTVSA